MKFDASVASFILGLVCASSGWVAWWVNKLQFDKYTSNQKAAADATKAYAAERDFNHLRNNQIQISDGIASGFKGLEQDVADGFKEIGNKVNELNQELIEIKAYMAIHAKTGSDRE